ncbi:MAG: hypothetical protein JKY31_09450 [Rhodobacteraceae bacterium]|nr:hypothetical protein [Paracoccaceae bacterium]
MKDFLKAITRLRKDEVGAKNPYNFFFSLNGPDGKSVLLVNQKTVPAQTIKDLRANSTSKKFMAGEMFVDDSGVLNLKADGNVPAGAQKAIMKDYVKKTSIRKVVIFSGDDDDENYETKSVDPIYQTEQTMSTDAQKRSGTHYYDADEKRASRVKIDADGRLLNAKGKPIEGYQGYVVDPETQKMHIFKKGEIAGSEDTFGTKERRYHSSPLAGGDVAGAGGIRMRDGKIERLDDRSGHYKPNSKLMFQTIEMLERDGAALIDKDLSTPDGKRVSFDKYEKLKKSLRLLANKVAEIESRMARNDRRLADPKIGAQRARIEKENMVLEASADQRITDYEIRRKLVVSIHAANRPTKVAIQGKEGRLDIADWEAGETNIDAMNDVIKEKLGITNFLADDYELLSLAQLNLDLGRVTEREMTVEQFKQASDDKARGAKDSASIAILLRQLDTEHGFIVDQPPSKFVLDNVRHPAVVKILRAMMAGKLEGDAAIEKLATAHKLIEIRAEEVRTRKAKAAVEKSDQKLGAVTGPKAEARAPVYSEDSDGSNDSDDDDDVSTDDSDSDSPARPPVYFEESDNDDLPDPLDQTRHKISKPNKKPRKRRI